MSQLDMSSAGSHGSLHFETHQCGSPGWSSNLSRRSTPNTEVRSKTFVAAAFIWLGPQLKGHGRFKSKLFQAQVEKCAREFEGSEDAQGPGLQLNYVVVLRERSENMRGAGKWGKWFCGWRCYKTIWFDHVAVLMVIWWGKCLQNDWIRSNQHWLPFQEQSLFYFFSFSWLSFSLYEQLLESWNHP